jgi:hypothetical protein
MTAHVPHIKSRVLTVFLLAGIPLLVLGVLLVLAVGQVRLRDNYGQHLGQVAQQTAAAVDAYVYRRLIDVSLIGRTPELRRAAAEASRRPFDRAAVGRVDAAWNKPNEAPAEANAVLAGPAAEYLADIVAHDQTYREMLLTDRFGRLAAASNRVSDFDQSDEDWWKAAFDDGVRGRVAVTDVRWDESSRRHAIEIAVPVIDPVSNRVAGILKVVADSREMLAMVGGAQLGATGQAMLLRDNGTIVWSRGLAQPGGRFFAADEVATRAAALRQAGPQEVTFFEAENRDGGDALVGIAPTQLAASYPNVSWIVAVTQAEDELLAPVRALGWYLLMVLALTALAVLAFALWFSTRIARPVLATDLHLVQHAPVMRVGETEEAVLQER